MTPESFTKNLYKTVAVENLEIYRNLFFNTSAEKASDPYWKQALTLFDSLSPEQREVFFNVIRQTIVDTTSNVLGVIDGVNSFDRPKSVFELSCDGDRIDGDLQSLFLNEAE